MNLRFFGVGDAREAYHEAFLSIDHDERDIVMIAEQAFDLFAFVHAQQAVIDEDAGELLADRLVDQHRGDRAVDAARQAAQHALAADLFADLGDLGGAELGHRPVARAAADVADEIRDQLGAIGGVDDLGVELRAIIAAIVVGDQRERRAVADRDDTEAGGELGDAVAVAHPHLVAFADLPQSVEKDAGLGDGQEGAAEFAVALAVGAAGLDPAAELLAHHLLAVADAEDREAAVEDRLRRARAAVRGDRSR